MTDHYVTDARHLLSTAERGIAAIEALGHAWIREDQFATFPSSTGDTPTSGGGTSDPTQKVAMSESDRYRERDRIGRALVRLVGQVEAEVARLQPRHTGGACDCCGSETATHGERRDGSPAECWACWRFRREHGFHCGPEVHKDRPKSRMCECECCDPCDQKAAENRTQCEKCRKRKYRHPDSMTA